MQTSMRNRAGYFRTLSVLVSGISLKTRIFFWECNNILGGIKMKTKSGFVMVEFLVVIVVLSVLAAIACS